MAIATASGIEVTVPWERSSQTTAIGSTNTAPVTNATIGKNRHERLAHCVCPVLCNLAFPQPIMPASAPSSRFSVRAQPLARRDEVVGVRDGVLIVRVRAPAIEGRANDAVCRLLAKRLGVPRVAVTVVRGGRGRDKVIQVDGLDQARVNEALGLGL